MLPRKRYNEHLRDISVDVPMRSKYRLKQSCHRSDLAAPPLAGGSFPDDLSSGSADTFSQHEQSQHTDDEDVDEPNRRIAGDVDSASDDSITFGAAADTSSVSYVSSASLSDEDDGSTDVPTSQAAPALTYGVTTVIVAPDRMED
ncbi:hypothetical protein HPB52_014167 [Rhipicephalus sanguineus]|uniref:Uncharacterized protein n=1 Tax=Rhipicephalus sanguineus TaxID=34632 RepID=A0A9D4SR08_RHISA|nr:hypothetical protein HPB52_014167 [Rhipicephalus sanguineus]